MAACGLTLSAQGVPDVAKLSATNNGLALYGATNLTLRGEPAGRGAETREMGFRPVGDAIRDWGEKRQCQRIQEDVSGRIQIYTATFDCIPPVGICASSAAGLVYARNRDTGATWHVGYGVGGVSDNGEWAVTATDVPANELRGSGIRRVRLMDGRIELAPAYSSGRETTWLHEDGVTPVTAANPATLEETVTARMTGMGPVDQSGNTVTAFEWTLLERSFLGPGGSVTVRASLPVLRSKPAEPGVYLVTLRLPEAIHGRGYQYLGIEVRPAGGGWT